LLPQAVFDVRRNDGTLVLREIGQGFTVDDVRKATGAPFEVDANLGTFD
jgi:acyl CoA:acetate/3-ketoacid CoA transferase beta subunit